MKFDLNITLCLDTDYDSESSVSISSSDQEGDNLSLENSKEHQSKDVPSKPTANEGRCNEEVGVDIDSNAELITEFERKLELGLAFGSLDQAHVFYCEYSREKGFSVRRGDQRYIGQTKELRWKDFVCHCAGLPYSGNEKGFVAGSRKQVKRSLCLAKIRVYPVGPDVWKNTNFIKDHNHPLLAPDQSYLLKSSRILSESRLGVLQSMNAAGIPVNMACGFMEVECGGHQNVGYIRKDAYDKLRLLKKENKTRNGDSVALLNYLNTHTNEDPFFFWRAVYDEEHRLKHFFFRDSTCLSDYECFGDVLSIDTTHKTNKYNLSCAPFVGLNHHSSNIMFGVGFLSDETTETFVWLLGVFLESMHGQHPKVVFSDQCKALMNAIDQVFQAATHRLCQWHVNNNAIKHFGSLNGNEEFKKMWYSCMNRVESEEEFESLWAEMMTKHVDPDCTWLPEMYTLRRRWACVFSQKIFTAGMVSTSCSEGTNNVLKAMIRSRSSLYEFVCAFEKIQARWRANERAEDAACLFLPGQFVKNNEMVMQAAQVYTRNVYKKFEYQCTEVYNVVVDWINTVHDGAGNVQFKASRHQYPDARRRTITFNRMTKIARCFCHMWEGQGILCRHILRVYQLMDVFLIPADLILKRWTKNAKDVVFSETGGRVISHNQDLGLFLDFSNLMLRSEFEMVAASKTSVKAQEYLLEMMQKTKAGFPAALNAISPTTVNGTHF